MRCCVKKRRRSAASRSMRQSSNVRSTQWLRWQGSDYLTYTMLDKRKGSLHWSLGPCLLTRILEASIRSGWLREKASPVLLWNSGRSRHGGLCVCKSLRKSRRRILRLIGEMIGCSLSPSLSCKNERTWLSIVFVVMDSMPGLMQRNGSSTLRLVLLCVYHLVSEHSPISRHYKKFIPFLRPCLSPCSYPHPGHLQYYRRFVYAPLDTCLDRSGGTLVVP